MIRRLLGLVPPLCSASASVLLAAWVGSRLATDRWIATQVMFWAPSALYLVPALLLAVIGLRPWSRRRPAGSARLNRRLGLATMGAAVLCVGWLLAVEWRVYRAVLGTGSGGGSQGLRLVHWNLGGMDRSFKVEALRDVATAWSGGKGPDVVFLGTILDRPRLEQAAALIGEGYTVKRWGPMAVISRWPVEELAADSLRIPTPDDLANEALTGETQPAGKGLYGVGWVQRFYNRATKALGVGGRNLEHADPGLLVRVRLDTTKAIGKETIVWVIDLPSSPLAPRHVLAKAAAARIEEIRKAGAPSPDVMLGDFNIPRGSESLWVIAAATGTPMREAFNQAGWGATGSWPRRRPIWLIDHVFTGPTMRATQYDTADPGVGEHRAQRVVVEAIASGHSQ